MTGFKESWLPHTIINIYKCQFCTYHTEQLNTCPNSSASHVVNYSRLSTCHGEMEPFNDHPSTGGYLTSFRNKPQQKQLGQPSAPTST